MAEDLLSSRAVAISLRDDLFDLLRHQYAYGDSVLRRDDLCASNRGLVELYREVSSAHASILRGAREATSNAERYLQWPELKRFRSAGVSPAGPARVPPPRLSENVGRFAGWRRETLRLRSG